MAGAQLRHRLGSRNRAAGAHRVPAGSERPRSRDRATVARRDLMAGCHVPRRRRTPDPRAAPLRRGALAGRSLIRLPRIDSCGRGRSRHRRALTKVDPESRRGRQPLASGLDARRRHPHRATRCFGSDTKREWSPAGSSRTTRSRERFSTSRGRRSSRVASRTSVDAARESLSSPVRARHSPLVSVPKVARRFRGVRRPCLQESARDRSRSTHLSVHRCDAAMEPVLQACPRGSLRDTSRATHPFGRDCDAAP
jgi:hypothetical protein